MTLYINIGRRVPKNWFKRQASNLKGMLSFQENMWLMIKQSMSVAKKKANASGKIKFLMTSEKENEDMNYQLEWLKIIIQGSKEAEEEEYNNTMKFYDKFNKVFKKDLPLDDRLKKHFVRSKILTPLQIEEAYQKGYGSIGSDNLANKLLEMGILTHVDWILDFDTREEEIIPDF
jgi:hypothetical protein